MSVTEPDWRPQYVRVAEELRDEIKSGALPPGGPLPSEPELAERFQLSRTSVRNAIKQLRDWGLIRSEQGRGTYVRAPRQRVYRNHTDRYQWEKDRVRLPEDERKKTGATEYDTDLEYQDLDFRASYNTAEATEELASRFSVARGTRLLQRNYWTSSKKEGVPLNLVRSYLVYDVAAANPELLDDKNEPWPGGTQHQLYTIGIELDKIVDEISARPPLPEEARTLAIEPGVSVLVLDKTSIDTNGEVVEYSEIIMPGDRTDIAYITHLTRWSQ